MRTRMVVILLAAALALPLTAGAGDKTSGAGAEADLRRKTFLLNAGVAGGLLLWGVLNWDYFQRSPRAENEGWFSHGTKSGGADKLGHAYSTYAASRAFRLVYLDWGYREERAGRLGILSALGIMTLMEVGDSFSSDFSFSYEDVLMNLAGAGYGYLMERYPDLNRKLDFRVEYQPEFGSDFSFDLLTDYEHLRFLLALKGSGFAALQNSWLGYLELHAGYYTRNYEAYRPEQPDHRERTLYLGLGLDVGRLLARWVKWPVFDYLQLPYTELRLEEQLD